MARLLQRASGLVRAAVGVAFIAGFSSALAMTASGESAQAPRAQGHELSLLHRSAEEPVDTEAAPSTATQFVQVEITQVSNPARVPVSFRVAFRDARGEQTELGTFSPFPPDNPGRFIIATQGKVRGRGHLVVTLVPLESVRGGEILRVQLKPLALVPG